MVEGVRVGVGLAVNAMRNPMRVFGVALLVPGVVGGDGVSELGRDEGKGVDASLAAFEPEPVVFNEAGGLVAVGVHLQRENFRRAAAGQPL